MLSVFLLILKIIGIILLSILGLVLAVILIILFVPIRYRIKAHKGTDKEDYGGIANVSFLLHIVSFTAQYEGSFVKYLKIFGIRFKKREKTKKSKNEKKQDGAYEVDWNGEEHNIDDSINSEVKQEVTDNTGKVTENSQEVTDNIQDNKANIEDDKANNQEDRDIDQEAKTDNQDSDKVSGAEDIGLPDKIRAIIDKISGFFDKGEEFADKLSNKLEDVSNKYNKYDKLINDYRNRRAFSLIWKKLKYLLVKLLPKKAKGRIHFGFDDPATNGQVCMYISILAPLIPHGIRFEPDFENEALDGEIDLKGRFALYCVLIVLLRLYFDKDVKRLYAMYKKQKNK